MHGPMYIKDLETLTVKETDDLVHDSRNPLQVVPLEKKKNLYFQSTGVTERQEQAKLLLLWTQPARKEESSLIKENKVTKEAAAIANNAAQNETAVFEKTQLKLIECRDAQNGAWHFLCSAVKIAIVSSVRTTVFSGLKEGVLLELL